MRSEQEKLDGWLSISQVLDYFQVAELVEWKLRVGKKQANIISKLALKVGKRVDEIIEQDIKGLVVDTKKDSIEIKNCWKAWNDFKRDYQPKIVATQVECRSQECMLVGRLDFLTNRIVDVKASSSIKLANWLQTAKYWDMRGRIEDGTAILRLDKNLGTYQYMTNEQAKINLGEAVKAFDGLMVAYRFYNAPKEQEEVCQQ